jgi:hypothetical protein
MTKITISNQSQNNNNDDNNNVQTRTYANISLVWCTEMGDLETTCTYPGPVHVYTPR